MSSALDGLSNTELKALITQAGLRYDGCLERSELLTVALQAQAAEQVSAAGGSYGTGSGNGGATATDGGAKTANITKPGGKPANERRPATGGAGSSGGGGSGGIDYSKW